MNLNNRHNLPGLQDAPRSGDLQQSQWMQQVTQVVRQGTGQHGSQEDKWLTLKDLEKLYIVEKTPKGNWTARADNQEPPPDMSPPEPLTNLEAKGGMTSIRVLWDLIEYNYYYRVEVHKASVDDLGEAFLVGTTQGNIYSDVVGSDTSTWYYWARVVKQVGSETIIGPWNQTKGTPANAASNPDWILDQISGKFDSNDLKTQVFTADLFGVRGFADDGNPAKRFSFAIDNTVSPPIVAIHGTSIVNASITTAQIGELDVEKLSGDTARFVEANVTDGSIVNAKIGNVIRSSNYKTDKAGWILNKAGFFECFQIKARGLVESSIIRGSVIEGGMFIQSDIKITTPTEADKGAGSIRYLSVVSVNEQVSSVNDRKGSSASTPILPIASANYTAEGYENYGDGDLQEPVYINLNRYLNYRIKPTVTAHALIRPVSGEYNVRYKFTLLGVNHNNTETEIYKGSWFSMNAPGQGTNSEGSWQAQVHSWEICQDTSCSRYSGIDEVSITIDRLEYLYNSKNFKGIKAKFEFSARSSITIKYITIKDVLSNYI